MTGKLKGVMAAATPSGWRSVNASTLDDDVGGVHAGQVDRQAAGELDRLEAAHDLGEGVREGLAVVARDERGQLLAVLVHERAEGEEDVAAGDERHVAPGREGGLGGGDGGVDLGLRRRAARGR